MITVLLVTDFVEVVIRHYDTDSEEEAAHLFGNDWAAGRVAIDSAKDTALFGPTWVRDSIDEALNDMTPQYENGVRVIRFYCTGGAHERDDRQAWAYFVHSIKKRGQQPAGGNGGSATEPQP
jgi:hypothetical protein